MRVQPRTALLVCAFMLLCVSGIQAQAWDPVTDAEKALQADPLDPGSGAVVLFKRGQIEVEERGRLNWITRIKTYTRIKILSEAGREAANVSFLADRVYRLASIQGRTIRPSGEIVPLDASQVFRTRAYESGKRFAIMKTSFAFPAIEPGSIIEYQTEEFRDWYFVRPWTFDTEGMSTLRSTLRTMVGTRLELAQLPLDTNINKITMKTSTVALGTGQASQTDYEVSNLYPIREEPYSSPFYDRAVRILFTPRRMGASGEVFVIIDRWDSVAEMITLWQKDFEKSSKATVAKARELTDKVPDERQRAEAIYKYIQQNISSSGVLGVNFGGTADDVLNEKRGDPDEINALFVTMAKAAKLNADLVLLAPRDWETLVGGFPSYGQIARAIVRMNLKAGPVLVEPADPGAPFGELPWYERGITALAVRGNKIQQVAIPLGQAEENQYSAKLASRITKDWIIETDAEVSFRGSEAVSFRGELLETPPERLEERLADYFSFGLAEAEASDVSHPELRDTSQPLTLKARVKYQIGEGAGPGLRLINPWIGDRYRSPVFTSTQRRSAVNFDYPERRTSTSTWKLLDGMRVDRLPQAVQVDNDLGSFSHACNQEGDTITCTRSFLLKKMTLGTTAEYMSAKKFFEEMAQHDREVMVLREQ